MNIKDIFNRQKKIYKYLEVAGVILGFVLIIKEYIIWIKPTPSFDLKEIIKLAENNDIDSITKIINNTKHDEINKDTYWFSKAIYSIMQPVSNTDSPISCIKNIDKDSKYYRYSIKLACSYLQSNISCKTQANKEIMDFAKFLNEKKGDNSPLVYVVYYIESTMERTNYGIGDRRAFPDHDNTNYRLCMLKPNYYIQAYKDIRNKFENDNFKISYKGVESRNVERNTTAQIELIYLGLPKLIGSLHGSAAISFYINGDLVNYNKEMQEFVKYYPDGISIKEKNAFLFTYGSVYLWLLDTMFKNNNMPFPQSLQGQN